MRHVINFVLPPNINTYINRIGRCARLGNEGIATSFFCMETDAELAPALVTNLRQADQIVPDFLQTYSEPANGRNQSTDDDW